VPVHDFSRSQGIDALSAPAWVAVVAAGPDALDEAIERAFEVDEVTS
jgi:hypothetical protein